MARHQYDRRICFNLTDLEGDMLHALSERNGFSQSAQLRQLIREAAGRELVDWGGDDRGLTQADEAGK